MPAHCRTVTAGAPASAMVGTSGSSGLRLSSSTASAQLAFLRERDRVALAEEARVQAPGDDVGHERAFALVRHVQHADAGGVHELHVVEDRQRVAGAVDELPRIRARVLDELLQRGRRHRGMRVEEDRRASDHRDRGEVGERVVGGLLAQRHGRGHRAVRGEHDGVAVGRLPGHHLGGDRAVGAGPVLDHHRLTELLRERGADDARRRIGRAAGREADDEADRLRRVLR